MSIQKCNESVCITACIAWFESFNTKFEGYRARAKFSMSPFSTWRNVFWSLTCEVKNVEVHGTSNSCFWHSLQLECVSFITQTRAQPSEESQRDITLLQGRLVFPCTHIFMLRISALWNVCTITTIISLRSTSKPKHTFIMWHYILTSADLLNFKRIPSDSFM
jgi:hypothetical protein